MSSGSFAKVYGVILDSSVWMEDAHTRITWITLLVMADANGFVEASVSGIARRANVTLDQCRTALDCFQNPDPDSKDPANEGRRVQRVDGGFFILNYEKYRERRTLTQVQTAERVKNWRDRRREQQSVTCNAGNAPKRSVRTEGEAEAEGEVDQEEEEREKRSRAERAKLSHSDHDPETEQIQTGIVDELLPKLATLHLAAKNVPLSNANQYRNVVARAVGDRPVSQVERIAAIVRWGLTRNKIHGFPFDRSGLRNLFTHWPHVETAAIEADIVSRIDPATGEPLPSWQENCRAVHVELCADRYTCERQQANDKFRVEQERRQAERDAAEAAAGGPAKYQALLHERKRAQFQGSQQVKWEEVCDRLHPTRCSGMVECMRLQNKTQRVQTAVAS